jgi:hypothetical protein
MVRCASKKARYFYVTTGMPIFRFLARQCQGIDKQLVISMPSLNALPAWLPHPHFVNKKEFDISDVNVCTYFASRSRG